MDQYNRKRKRLRKAACTHEKARTKDLGDGIRRIECPCGHSKLQMVEVWEYRPGRPSTS